MLFNGNKLTVIFFPCIIFLLLSSCSGLVIKNVNLFDPHTGLMLPGRTIVIKGERISAIGTSANPTDIPFFTKVIDGKDKYVIPGLIDAHSHLNFLFDSLNVKAEDMLPLYLFNGVTSVRDIGDGIEIQKRIAAHAKANPGTCPAVFMCSPLIDGAHPFHWPDSVSIPMIDTSKVPAYIMKLVADGVSTLKIYVYAQPEIFRKVIEEGHKHGLTVAAHLPSNVVETQDALDWGIDVIEHIFGAPENTAMVTQMVAQGVMLDPTLVVFKNMMLLTDQPEVYQNKDNSYMPDTVLKSWNIYRENAKWVGMKFSPGNLALRKKQMKKYMDITGDLYRAGVILLAGSDSPEPFCPPGFALHQELELLVASGLPAAAALNCATINNARALKQEKNIGSIEAGKIADMVILSDNPLNDIRNSRKIEQVIHMGKIAARQLK